MPIQNFCLWATLPWNCFDNNLRNISWFQNFWSQVHDVIPVWWQNCLRRQFVYLIASLYLSGLLYLFILSLLFYFLFHLLLQLSSLLYFIFLEFWFFNFLSDLILQMERWLSVVSAQSDRSQIFVEALKDWYPIWWW